MKSTPLGFQNFSLATVCIFLPTSHSYPLIPKVLLGSCGHSHASLPSFLSAQVFERVPPLRNFNFIKLSQFLAFFFLLPLFQATAKWHLQSLAERIRSLHHRQSGKNSVKQLKSETSGYSWPTRSFWEVSFSAILRYFFTSQESLPSKVGVLIIFHFLINLDAADTLNVLTGVILLYDYTFAA